MKKYFTLILFNCLIISAINAQNLDSLLTSETEVEPEYATATFKSTRIINFQSVEQLRTKHLDFRIHHRFGPVNDGAYNFYGLDNGVITMSFEYGVTDWAEVGISRGSAEKTFNAFGKFRILRQSSGSKVMPVSVSAYASTDFYTLKRTDVVLKNIDRFSYIYQIMVARKFNESFSLQFTPTLIHQNLVKTALNPNDTWAFGLGGRMKLTRRSSFNSEYSYAIRPNYVGAIKTANGLSLGFDIETGGHVFQVMLTNTNGMIERKFITESAGSWLKGNFMLGFNISRTFSFKKD